MTTHRRLRRPRLLLPVATTLLLGAVVGGCASQLQLELDRTRLALQREQMEAATARADAERARLEADRARLDAQHSIAQASAACQLPPPEPPPAAVPSPPPAEPARHTPLKTPFTADSTPAVSIMQGRFTFGEGEPTVVTVTVRGMGIDESFRSDDQGRIALELPVGPYKATLAAEGYKTRTVSFKLGKKETFVRSKLTPKGKAKAKAADKAEPAKAPTP